MHCLKLPWESIIASPSNPYYTYPMAITQTVEIPANRWITLEVPREVPTGSVVLTFTPKEVPATDGQPKERLFGCAKGKYHMADDFDAPLDDFKDYM